MGERKFILMRSKTLFNSNVPWYVFIDGKRCGEIYGGETKEYIVDSQEHVLLVKDDEPKIIEYRGVRVSSGNEDRMFKVELGFGYANAQFGTCMTIKCL